MPFPEGSLRKSKSNPSPKEHPIKKNESDVPTDLEKLKSDASLKKDKAPPKAVVNRPGMRLSIKEMLEKEKALKNQSSEALPEENYTPDRLTRVWRQYAFQVKDEGKETFYNALVKRDPLIEKNDILKLFVENQIQVDYITPLLNDLISFLRNSLKNHNINVLIELIENPAEDVKFLNGKDKFEVMAKKNPELNTLKNLFNLDIEF